jgi:hypothetical protein
MIHGCGGKIFVHKKMEVSFMSANAWKKTKVPGSSSRACGSQICMLIQVIWQVKKSNRPCVSNCELPLHDANRSNIVRFLSSKDCLVGCPAKIVGWSFSLYAGNTCGKKFSGQK